ncbi:MAG: serine protease [Clostridiaceae bacterium]|nr:serine protease [Clostridiaceae bacterium]
MKKLIIGFIFGAILMLSVNVAADTYYQFVASQNTLYVDDAKVEYPMYNYQYTNYASIRGVAEALGLDIKVTDKRIDFTSPFTDLETVAKNCKDSCVMIYAYKGDMRYQGSGFIYNGYVITAKHVVDRAEKIDVFLDDSIYSISASIVPIDTDLDISVLKTYTTNPSVILGDSDKLIEGQKLVSITSPDGGKNTIDECVFSGKIYGYGKYFLNLSDTFMTGGSSGGAVFNYDSEILGIMSMGADGAVSATPINDIKPILEKLK